jgi:hypothetical protein
VVAGGRLTEKPPTEIVVGAVPVAPNQLGLVALPVPGYVWHMLQSVLPDVFENALWSCRVRPGLGLTFMWQLLQRPVVPFKMSAVAPVN